MSGWYKKKKHFKSKSRKIRKLVLLLKLKLVRDKKKIILFG